MPQKANTLQPAPVDSSQLFAPLGRVELARKGPAIYYPTILDSKDEYIRVGGYCQMLALKVLPPERFDTVLALCHHPAIKERAFDFFQAGLLPDLAAHVASMPSTNPDTVRTGLMKAELAFDHAAVCVSRAGLFLVTGEVKDLVRAARDVEHIGGWRAAAEWFVRAMAISPIDPYPAAELCRVLAEANQFALITDLNKVLGRAGLHPFIVGVYAANTLLENGDPKACLAKLALLKPPSVPGSPLANTHGYALRLAAEAQDKLGDYQASYRSYVEMNRADMTPGIDGKAMIRIAQRDAAIAYPRLSPMSRDDVTMLLGFPRSGTTLLEMVLDSHPEIEAMEEPTTWDAAMAQLRLGTRPKAAALLGQPGGGVFEAARDRYYTEVERRRKKSGARFVVDKYPMRTIYAVPLSRLLPDQKYIFSIRHPFDVVLSCFRQRFERNAGMANFHTIKDGIEFYDFTMSQWFSVHSLADTQVKYVRYDELVTSFDATLQGVLDFIGAEWNEGVRDFAEGSQSRSALTPSYQKIRRGLSIGVQSAWRRYSFLFEGQEAAPLRKWADFFGYESK
ncbi:MAG: sulfotransferase [Devosia sp.]